MDLTLTKKNRLRTLELALRPDSCGATQLTQMINH